MFVLASSEIDYTKLRTKKLSFISLLEIFFNVLMIVEFS